EGVDLIGGADAVELLVDRPQDDGRGNRMSRQVASPDLDGREVAWTVTRGAGRQIDLEPAIGHPELGVEGRRSHVAMTGEPHRADLEVRCRPTSEGRREA